MSVFSVQQIVFDTLQANETLRMADDALKLLLIGKLHFNMRSVAYLQSSKFSAIAKYRSQYNRGLLGAVPCVCSFRYLDGVAVNRNGNPLTEDEQRDACVKHGIKDERFVQSDSTIYVEV